MQYAALKTVDLRMRLFVAILLPESIKNELIIIQNAIIESYINSQMAGLSKPRQNMKDFKIYASGPGNRIGSMGKRISKNNLHLTLTFIGDVDLKKIPEIIIRLSSISLTKFSVSFQSIEYIPRGSHRGLIWTEGESSSEYTRLKTQVDEALDIKDISRKILPHITLFRLKSGNRILLKRIMKEAHFQPFSFDIVSFSLMQSIRTEHESNYLELERFPIS